MSEQIEQFWFSGGVNLQAPALSLGNGELIGCKNYECSPNGGYRRIDGYEAFDGQTAPSSLDVGDYASTTAWQTAMEAARANIDAVPGEGDILGVWQLGAVVYAFRNKTGGASAGMYKSTAAGWVEVDTEQLTLAFTSGSDEIEVGDTIEGAVSGATATICAVHITSGSWAGTDAAGNLILCDQTGTFQSENLNVGASTNVATIGGNSSSVAVTLNPSGKYEFVNYNFGGHSGTLKMYGCDGKNKAFEYDGTNYTEIHTGMTTDTPEHIFAHKNHLFLSFSGGSVQFSPIGVPTGTWSLVTGASEFGIGDEVTGFQDAPGGVLTIGSQKGVGIITGSSSADFAWKPFSSKTGVKEWTMQRLGEPMFLDDYGVTVLSAVDAYGDFKTFSLTQKVQKLIELKGSSVVASAALRSKDQYRLFFSDKSVLTISFSGGQPIGCTTQFYDHQVTCVSVCEDSNGIEKAYFGCDDGYVYQLDSGNNFNGNSIGAWVRLAFNYFKAPQNRKRFFKVVLEVDITAQTDLEFTPLFDYGAVDAPNASSTEATVAGGGGIWGEPLWGQFYWGAQLVGEAYGYFDGEGKNLSLYIRSDDTYENPHILQGATFHYVMRGLRR